MFKILDFATANIIHHINMNVIREIHYVNCIWSNLECVKNRIHSETYGYVLGAVSDCLLLVVLSHQSNFHEKVLHSVNVYSKKFKSIHLINHHMCCGTVPLVKECEICIVNYIHHNSIHPLISI